jgi:putative endopeptidase
MRLSLLLVGVSLIASTTALDAKVRHRKAAAPKTEAAVVLPKPAIGTFGFDEAGMDKSIAPGDNFYGYANGTWAKTTPIPPDRSNYGEFTALDELSFQRTHNILEAAKADPNSKIGALYSSFMDEQAAEAKDITPLQPYLDAIETIQTRDDFVRQVAALYRAGLFEGPFQPYIGQDDKAPDSYIAGFYQGGLGLPDRDYYLKDDAKLIEARNAYIAYLARLFDLIGEKNGSARAQAVVGFETGLASSHWTRIDSRDSTKTYNKLQRAELDKLAPGFNWGLLLNGVGLGNQTAFLIAQPSAFTASANLINTTPVATLRDYLLVHAVNGAAPYLSKRFVEAEFAFDGTVLNGTPENRVRWKRGVDLVKGQMGEAVGKDYVAKYFPPEAKAEADKLVHNIIAAMDERLSRLIWMDPATKIAARAKLAAFTPKIGYPEKWRDYSALEIKRDDLFGNVVRGNQFEWQRNLNKLGKPIDRGEWGMTPMEVNAYANPVKNEIVFPAAILQPPFFDPKADPAVNYGGIGAVIGHETSHHFDDQGRKYDKTGKLTDWWTDADVKRFAALTDALVKQYDAYEPLPGQHVQGALTLGENIADLAGLTVAYDAYKISLQGKKAPVIDGFTGDQRFYFGWAQVWRRNYREANLRQRLLTDPHSPSEQRAWVVRNLDPWYAAFGIKPGTKLYLAPAERVRIW